MTTLARLLAVLPWLACIAVAAHVSDDWRHDAYLTQRRKAPGRNGQR